ncbi:IS1096 element passenger TnpR family protein [Micromonospora sp. NPDC003776]
MEGKAVARTWLSIRVELVSGRGIDLWPRPGRVFAASRSHTFARFADAIDLAFARWDLAHIHMFTLADQRQITPLELWDGEAPEGSIDSDRTKLSRLGGAEQFAYVFDFGDDWAHLCTVAESRIDPLETLGGLPAGPMPYFSMAGAGTATTATHSRPNRRASRSPNFHRCCRGGDRANADSNGPGVQPTKPPCAPSRMPI